MSFATELASDLDKVFLNTAEFAETVTYQPSNSAQKSIRAIVDRHPVRPEGPLGRMSPARVVELWIASDATLGIQTVREGEDRVLLKLDLDDLEARWLRITKRLEQATASGLWKLEAQQ